MKFTLITFLIICFNSISQNSGTFIYVPNYNVLYRGYHNPVEFGVTDGSNYRITLEGLELKTDTTFFSDKFGHGSDVVRYYLLPTGRGRNAKVTFIDTLNRDTLGIHEFRLANLPDPTLYWGGAKDGERASIKETIIFAKYGPEIPMRAEFTVTSWNIINENDTITGTGSKISTAESFLSKIEVNTTLQILTTVIGPDGISRIIKGEWKVLPWKEDKGSEIIVQPGG